MRITSLFIAPLVILSVAGGGCFPSAVTPATPAPSVTPPAPPYSSVQPDGTLITKKGEKDTIRLRVPTPGGQISRPLLLAGDAKGWYFEATFPVALLNQNGVRIATGRVEADGDWMTADFVPFTGELEYPLQDPGSKGTLILMKDNPSGLPEHDDSVEIPIIF